MSCASRSRHCPKRVLRNWIDFRVDRAATSPQRCCLVQHLYGKFAHSKWRDAGQEPEDSHHCVFLSSNYYLICTPVLAKWVWTWKLILKERIRNTTLRHVTSSRAPNQQWQLWPSLSLVLKALGVPGAKAFEGLMRQELTVELGSLLSIPRLFPIRTLRVFGTLSILIREFRFLIG